MTCGSMQDKNLKHVVCFQGDRALHNVKNISLLPHDGEHVLLLA